MTNNPNLPKDVNAVIKRLINKRKVFSGRPPRDPARIAGLLKALEEVWRDYPDWRLGQIIVNATRYSRPSFVCPEIFHLEDDDMLKGMEDLVKKQHK